MGRVNILSKQLFLLRYIYHYLTFPLFYLHHDTKSRFGRRKSSCTLLSLHDRCALLNLHACVKSCRRASVHFFTCWCQVLPEGFCALLYMLPSGSAIGLLYTHLHAGVRSCRRASAHSFTCCRQFLPEGFCALHYMLPLGPAGGLLCTSSHAAVRSCRWASVHFFTCWRQVLPEGFCAFLHMLPSGLGNT